MKKIIHGNSFKILKTIPNKSVDLIFVDPPYNLQLKDTLYRPDQTTVEPLHYPDRIQKMYFRRRAYR